MLPLVLLAGCMQGEGDSALARQALALRTEALAPAFHPCERNRDTPTPALVAASRCLEFEVVENPASPEGRRIPLRVMVVPAIRALPEADPFVILVGGPGQAATDAALPVLPAFERIRQSRDILLVDQRGTGRLSPFGCDFGSDDALPLSTALAVQGQREALQRCLATSEAAPEYYTTDLAVQDLEAVRVHLGYRALNLWGVSYGTRVALGYLKQFPATTRTVVLDGVAPAGILPLEAARDGHRALLRVFELCAQEAPCNTTFADLPARYEALLAQYATPQPVTLRAADGSLQELMLDRALLESRLLQLLYSRETARLVPLFIAELARGNLGVLGWGEQGEGGIDVAMHYSVVCSEDLPQVSQAELAAAATDPGVLAYELLVQPRVEGCGLWPTRTLPEDFFEPVQSEVPVLVFSADQDPVTPPRWGEQAVAGLRNSLHLVAGGVGHGVFAYGCSSALVAEFVDSGTLAGLDGSCISELGPRPFFTTWNGSGGSD